MVERAPIIVFFLLISPDLFEGWVEYPINRGCLAGARARPVKK